MSGFWILFSVTVGGALFGIVGMFLGVPIFALIYAGVQDYIQVRLRNKKSQSTIEQELLIELLPVKRTEKKYKIFPASS